MQWDNNANMKKLYYFHLKFISFIEIKINEINKCIDGLIVINFLLLY